MAEKNLSDLAEAKVPLFGWLSLLAPVLGVLGFFVLIQFWEDDPAGFGGLFIAIYSALGVCLIGLGFGVVGFVRRERLKWLYLMGFMINLFSCLSVLKFVFH